MFVLAPQPHHEGGVGLMGTTTIPQPIRTLGLIQLKTTPNRCLFLFGFGTTRHREGVWFARSQPHRKGCLLVRINSPRGVFVLLFHPTPQARQGCCWGLVSPFANSPKWVRLDLLISAPIRCIWLCLFYAHQGRLDMLISAPTAGVC